MHKLINKYNKLKKKYPDVAEDMVMILFDKMEEDDADEVLDEYEIKKKFGCHIGTEELYEKAVYPLEWVGNKGEGEKWSVDEIARLSGIDFVNKKYTKYDFAYVVNMFYSDNCNISELSSSSYLKMAKNYLEDSDPADGKDPSERAYRDAKERIKNYYEK